MKIHEYQARELFEKSGIPVPKGSLCKSPEEVRSVAISIGKPVVVKAQVLVAGRGKAGGIKMAKDPEEAFVVAKSLLGSFIKGILVNSVLVVESVGAEKELYLGLTIDRSSRKVVLISSAEGGIDLEELAKKDSSKIIREDIEPLLGLMSFQARNAATSIGLSGKIAEQYSSSCLKLYSIFTSKDCDLAESNPLAIDSSTGSLVALDARITLDGNASFRHPEYKRSDDELSPLEAEAQSAGLSFVQLDGDIGIIGNGAGLVMATLDVVAYFGGKPANFLDMGGGSKPEEVYRAVKICLSQKDLKALFVNILGGITKCDDVAVGLLRALGEATSKVPVIVRMVGTNEEAGRKILSENGISYLDSMEEAAEVVVKSAREGSWQK